MATLLIAIAAWCGDPRAWRSGAPTEVAQCRSRILECVEFEAHKWNDKVLAERHEFLRCFK